MTKNPISVNLSNSMRDVDRIFKERTIHHLPVVSGNRIIGLISKTDLERISFVNQLDENGAHTAVYDHLTIDQVMTKDVVTVDESTQIKEAAQILAKGTFHALPVVKDDQLSGILTSTDLINHLLEQYN